jgi:hypothetical protein
MITLQIPWPARARAARIRSASVDDDWITLALVDGRSLRVPTAFSMPLYLAGAGERRAWRLGARGRVVRWPALGVVVGVERVRRASPAVRSGNG